MLKRIGQCLRIIIITVFFFAATLPILWVFITSFKTESAARDKQLRIIPGKTDGLVFVKLDTFEFKNINGYIKDEVKDQLTIETIDHQKIIINRHDIVQLQRIEKRNLIKLKDGSQHAGFIIDSNIAFITLLTVENKKMMISHNDIKEKGIQAAVIDNLKFKATIEDSYSQLKQADDGHSFFEYLYNSIFIASISTICAVLFGTTTAYGFSRFKVPGSKDWLFFILATRFLPPLAIVVPVLIMYQELNLDNSHIGMIILYTAFNLSLSVWLMKGFIDDIPKAYEEAAMVDGYSQFQTFIKIVLPESMNGMAITAVFCLISAWNEYSFAMILNGKVNWTVPVYFGIQRDLIDGTPWPLIAAGIIVFLFPIAIFVSLARKHLLRGVTFGTIKG